MGHSPCHAGSVALVLNPTTGHVSPQFHVVFDDTFSTVPFMREGTVPSHWAELVRNSSEVATDESFDIAKTWFEGEFDPMDVAPNDISLTPLQPVDNNDESATKPALPNNSATLPPVNEGDSGLAQITPDQNNPVDPLNPMIAESPLASTPYQGSEGDSHKMPKMINLDTIGLRRSTRLQKKRILSTIAATTMIFFSALSNSAFPVVVDKEGLSVTQRLSHRFQTINANFDGTINGVHNSVFTATADNDCYTYTSMQKQPDKAEFIQAMLKETEVHEQRNHWTRMLRSDLPPGAKTILSIWSFKRK
jgi:hypothetical protein